MNTSFEPQSQTPTRRAPRQESRSAKARPSRTIVHAKLEMTEPGDHDEQEADAVANAIVSGGKISRKISGGGGSSGIAVSQQMESQLSQLQGGGRQMPEGLRNMMESGLGQDFSQVRLHTDNEAASMSSSIQAKAFTLGNDIYFNRGQFAPETSEGQRLVAHELTHVVQGTEKVGRQKKAEDETDQSTQTDIQRAILISIVNEMSEDIEGKKAMDYNDSNIKDVNIDDILGENEKVVNLDYARDGFDNKTPGNVPAIKTREITKIIEKKDDTNGKITKEEVKEMEEYIAYYYLTSSSDFKNYINSLKKNTTYILKEGYKNGKFRKGVGPQRGSGPFNGDGDKCNMFVVNMLYDTYASMTSQETATQKFGEWGLFRVEKGKIKAINTVSNIYEKAILRENSVFQKINNIEEIEPGDIIIWTFKRLSDSIQKPHHIEIATNKIKKKDKDNDKKEQTTNDEKKNIHYELTSIGAHEKGAYKTSRDIIIAEKEFNFETLRFSDISDKKLIETKKGGKVYTYPRKEIKTMYCDNTPSPGGPIEFYRFTPTK